MFVVAAACSGPTTPPPTPPTDPGPQTAPVIRAITVPTSRVEAGVDIALSATVEDAETPLTQLTYQWAASAGTITGSGTTATWTIPKGITAGVDVTVTLTVIDNYQALVNNQLVPRQHVVVGTATPFRVHDSEAELLHLAVSVNAAELWIAKEGYRNARFEIVGAEDDDGAGEAGIAA